MTVTPPETAAATVTTADPRVEQVLAEIHRRAARNDKTAMERALATVADWDSPPTVAETTELCGEAALPLHPDTGSLLYVLVRTLRPTRVVEFGTSFGASLIWIAAALRDNGNGGTVIGSELHPVKTVRARDNLARAGLAEHAVVLEGDARTTLARIEGPVDLVLLDGWKDLYLPVLHLLEPALRPGALVVADNLPLLPDDYLAHVRTPANGYASASLTVGDGLELSTRTR
ncbi:O-methyltransferase [Kitasatospora sp. NPDC054939]